MMMTRLKRSYKSSHPQRRKLNRQKRLKRNRWHPVQATNRPAKNVRLDFVPLGTQNLSASNQSVQQKDRRKSKHHENFNQKPAKVKKNRKTSQNESNEGIQIETNVIQPLQEDKTARKSTRQVSKVSMRDIETQNAFDHKEDDSQVKCLLSFILFFTIVTCGFIVYLFYVSLHSHFSRE